jgi:hypothetical protein
MSGDEVLERLTTLEVKEAVREHIARYCAIVDTLSRPDELAELFAEDALVRNPNVYEGRQAIRDYYETFFTSGVTFARHYVMNQVVTVESADRARHTSSFLAVFGREGKSLVAFGRYDDVLERRGGAWLFVDKGTAIDVMTSLDAGWGGETSGRPPWRAAGEA